MSSDKHWIQTRSGLAVDLLDPQPDQIDLGDVCHALEQLCRYTGHCAYHYSVATHSLNVGALLLREGGDELMGLCGLLHDATEAYVGDVASPLKRLLPEYQIIEARFAAVIAERFGLPHPMPAAVKTADLRMLRTEAPALLPWPPPRSWGAWFDELEPWPLWRAQYPRGALRDAVEQLMSRRSH